ncbi:hypothetical protein [Paraburkholderia graminis]
MNIEIPVPTSLQFFKIQALIGKDANLPTMDTLQRFLEDLVKDGVTYTIIARYVVFDTQEEADYFKQHYADLILEASGAGQ